MRAKPMVRSSSKSGEQSKAFMRPHFRELTRLQTFVKRHDYTAMLRIVTPSLFRRALSDATARPILLRVEKDLFQQAQRLLREGNFKGAAKLLNKVVRLGGKLRPRAQKLVQTTEKARTETGSIPIRVVSGRRAKQGVKKNGGGARATKPSRMELAGQRKAAAAKKRLEKKAPPKPVPAPGRPALPSRIRVPSSGSPMVSSEAPTHRKVRRRGWAKARPPEELPPPPQPSQPPAQEAPVDVQVEEFEAPRGNGGSDAGATTDTAAEPGERRGGRAREQAEVLRRTPHMDLSPEAPLQPNTEFEVYVSVDTKSAKPGEESEDFIVKAPASQEEFPVQVTLVVSGHFELRDTSSKPMTIFRSRESVPAGFKVRSVKEFPSEPDGALSALFSYKGHPSGRVTRRFRVENGRLVSALPTKSTALAAPGSAAPPPPPPQLAVIAGLDPYDLTISVADTGENDFRHFHLIADAPAIGKHLEVPWNLSDKTGEIVSNYMKDFVAEGLEPTTRLAQLKGAGVQLFRATPPEFQKLFWEMIDASKPPKTILVVSDDPYIPWELMVPRRSVARKIQTLKPLGVEFCVGRWIRGDYTSPPQQIRLDRTYVVAPTYVIASKNLKWAPQEAAFVCSSFKPSSTIDPADFDKIEKALQDKGITLLHFICHGAADSTQQTVYLRDMVNNLSGSVMEGSDEFVTAFFRDHTFVFLNACEVGRTAPALVGVNGLPATFLRLGASGVVAALWSVKDDLAHQVAETFYRTVLQQPQKPFAEILRDIRSQAYAGSAEDTYAAYCFYGSPLARRKL